MCFPPWKLSLLLLIASSDAWAAPTNGVPSDTSSSTALRLAVQLTVFAVIPMFFVTLTPFLRISVILHFLRQALGTQTVPSNQIIIALASMLAVLSISPQVKAIYEQGVLPYNAGRLSEEKVLVLAADQLKSYMLPHLGEKEIAMMLRVSKQTAPATPRDLAFPVVAGAYMLSELKAAFRIGVMLFMPFLMIDLIVSAVIVTLGMVQLPPVMVSAPFKILIFVLADGWTVIIDSIMKSFEVVR
jgi:flagellar biosynthetic protein FliP